MYPHRRVLPCMFLAWLLAKALFEHLLTKRYSKRYATTQGSVQYFSWEDTSRSTPYGEGGDDGGREGRAVGKGGRGGLWERGGRGGLWEREGGEGCEKGREGRAVRKGGRGGLWEREGGEGCEKGREGRAVRKGGRGGL